MGLGVNLMKKLVMLFVLTMISTQLFAARPRESKCVVKLKFKVERENNRQYLWCLDGFEEDGPGYFYTTRRYVMKGISKEECDKQAYTSIGEKAELPFVSAPPAGMVIVMEQDPYRCEGVVESVHKIKYRPAR